MTTTISLLIIVPIYFLHQFSTSYLKKLAGKRHLAPNESVERFRRQYTYIRPMTDLISAQVILTLDWIGILSADLSQFPSNLASSTISTIRSTLDRHVELADSLLYSCPMSQELITNHCPPPSAGTVGIEGSHMNSSPLVPEINNVNWIMPSFSNLKAFI